MSENVSASPSSPPAAVAANRGLLEVAAVEKSFGANAVLRGIDFAIDPGEIHALLGENGAGKSTLMRILLGVERADRGTMRVGGATYAPRNPAAARRRGIVMVPQERTLCPDLTVAENIVLGLERGFVLDAARTRHAARQALTMVAAERIDLDLRARHLSVADQQLVEIARALLQGGAYEGAETGAGQAKVLILDEPTSSLGRDDATRLFERVATLSASGLAIILVTHFLEDVRVHTSRYTILRDGKVAGRGDSKTTPPEDLVRAMLGRDVEPARHAPSAGDPAESGDVVLEVDELGGHERPKAVSFAVRRGEIFGIAGLVGSGRTEILRMVAGLDRPKQGKVIVRAPRGVGLLSEDRAGEGLMLGRSIAENVALSPRGPFFTSPRAILAAGARWIAELGVKARGPEQAVGELSGGNQQKVQIARLVREDYDVLLIDEPTRGIDVASKAQVLSRLRELAANGKAIVLVSSQLDELVTTCDRIAVLRRGALGASRPATEWSEAKLLLEAAS